MSQPYSQPPHYQGNPVPMSPGDERTWGTLAHIIPLAAMALSAGFLGFIGSLVVYLIYKDRGPFVRRNAANSLNVQIMTFIIIVVSVPLMLILVGFISYLAAFLFAVVVHIIGAVKANRGEWWDPPMTPIFVRG